MGMRKTLYIHIGHFKTGTTALQTFLACNPKFLARNGLDYAPVSLKHAKHSRLAFSIYRAAGVETLMHGYANTTPPEELWAELFDYVRASPQPRVIVSTEEFMRMGTFPEAAAQLPALAELGYDIDIRIIAYLRAPDAHLRSWYNQLVKMKVKVPDFNLALRHVIEPVHYDYALALRPWVETFGAEAVTVRPYDKASREGNALFADFLSIFGVSLPEKWIYLPKKDPNPRLDDRTLEIVRLMQNAGLPKEAVRWTEKRAVRALESARGGMPEDAAGEGPGFDEIRQRIREGLSGLEDLPGNGVDCATFAGRLPKPEPESLVEARQMIGVLLNEIYQLRKRVNGTLPDILKRLEALEGGKGDKTP